MDDDKDGGYGSDKLLEGSSDGTRKKDKGTHEGKYASDRYRDHSDTEQGGLSSGWKANVIFTPYLHHIYTIFTTTSQQFQEKYVKSIAEADAILRLPDGFLDKLGKPVEDACEIQEIEQYHSKIINIDSMGEDSTKLEDHCKIAGIESPLNVTLQKDLSGSVTSKRAQLKVDESVHGRLYTACTEGDLKSVEAILDEHYDTLMPDERGQTPLYAACIGNQPQIIEYLVARRFTVDHQDNDGKTPLHIAYECRQPEIADLLVDKYKANWKLRDAQRWTPLHAALDQGYHGFCSRHLEEFLAEDIGTDVMWLQLIAACFEGKSDTVQLLLDANVDVNHASSCGYTALHAACYKNIGDVVGLLLRNGARETINHRTSVEVNAAPIHYACAFADAEVVQLLLDNGADPNLPNKYGETPCHIAVWKQKTETLQCLLRCADLNLQAVDSDGETCLHRAVREGNLEIITLLLEHNAVPNARGESRGKCSQQTPHELEDKSAPTKHKAKLHKAGIDISLANKDGNTCLHLALFEQCSIEIIQILVEHGSPLNHKNKAGRTPLMIACWNQNQEAIELLLSHDCDPNIPGEQGNAALHFAIHRRCDHRIIQALIDRGANVDLLNDEQESPLMRACEEEENHETISVLLKAKADLSLADKDGNTALHLAILNKAGIEVLKKIISHCQQAHLDAINNKGNSALMLACVEGPDDTVALLLQAGSSTALCNKVGNTALHIAILNKAGIEVLKKIIPHCQQAQLDTITNEGHSALMVACGYGQDDTVALLLQAGASTTLCDKNGNTALHHAISNKSGIDIMKQLIPHYKQAHLDAIDNQGNSALMLACWFGQDDTVALLLQAGASATLCNKDGNTALHLAISNKSGIDIMKQLIPHYKQAHLDAINNQGNSALMLACWFGQDDTVALLLQAGASATLCNKDGNTALHLAILNKSGIDIMKQLIPHYKQAHLDAITNEGNSALMLACGCGQGDTVALLLQAGASTTLCNEYGFTALDLAIAMKAGIDVLKELILHCQQAQLDAINDEGRSALMLACICGQDDTVALLLQAGASTTLYDKKGVTCLYLAVRKGCSLDTVRALLDHGAPVNAISNGTYTTALSAACVHASVSVVQLLLEHGANPNISDSDDRTPLRWCCNPDVKPKVNDRLAKAALLLKYGDDPEKKDAEGRKPLDYAVEEESLDLLKVLFDHDPATLDMTLDSGETALHFCCKNGMTDMAKWLLEHGVDKDRVCDAGTPLELALSHGHKNIVYLLLNAGANASLSAERTGFMERIYRQRRRFKDILQHIVKQKCNVDFTARDANHETLFFKACRDDDKDVVKMLLDSKHDIGINLCNNQGQSPVWVTCKNASKVGCDALSILHFIVRGNREVDVDRPDHTQTTPLHLVCQEDTPAMVNLIVHTSDKSVNARDAKGRTPLQLATRPAVIDLLERFGATKDYSEVQHQLPGTSGSATDDRRTFHKLSTQGTSGMFCDGDLCIMYGASQGLGIEEIVIGLSENSADLPELRAGQRRLTPVLICMPHNAALSSSLSINLPVPPHTGAITVLYSPASDTQHQQQAGGEWRPVHDVCCFIHEHSISLVLTHFCMYCIVEETLQPSYLCKYCTEERQSQPQPQPQTLPSLRNIIFSVFLRKKTLKTKACVEITLQWSQSRDAAPVAELRGKLVKQKTFPLINTRPITISIEPADGWTARQDLEEAIYYRELIECDSLTFDLFGDAATQEMVEFKVLLAQCQGYERTLYVCMSYEELVRESTCRSRAVQEDAGRQSNPSNPLDFDNNIPTMSQLADVAHVPMTASNLKRSLMCQDTNQIGPHTEIASGNGTSLMTAQSHIVASGNLPEQQQAAIVDEVSYEIVPDNHRTMNFCEPVPEPAPRSEIERADSEPSRSASAEDGQSSDASGSLESGFGESVRAAQSDFSDSMGPSLADDEAQVPGAGGETAGNMALVGVTSAGHLVPTLSNLPPGHGPVQVVNVVNNYYSQEAISHLLPGSGRLWLISYEKCAKVAQYLDLKDHDWKMLASKLNFDEAIDEVERQASIKRVSPTILLLREWILKYRKKGAETLKERLKQALRALRRVDIVDEMDDLDNVHVDEMDETDEMDSSENE